ncbi:MAG: LLM class flavin-dependent oxidoreductase [Chloroflexaceae bacterium]|nr:LLM class flavin-dependent oxidoreductase [Chloroflexaceae bacterium]
MEIGIDSFAAARTQHDHYSPQASSHALGELLERMHVADQVGMDVFGIGEHYRPEFLDSAPTVILAAAAARITRMRLTSAVTVLSAADQAARQHPLCVPACWACR